VMMGNFLTTLGNTPETDREMFEELGLNVARQPDNATNPRPDNRSGWLTGETPDVVEQLLDGEPAETIRARRGDAPAGARADDELALVEASAGEIEIRLWDPSTQLRYRAKRSVPPRPDGAPNRGPAATPGRMHDAGEEPAERPPSPVAAG
jgi:biotin synthase